MEISPENSSPRLRLDHLRREGLGFELEPYDQSREVRPMGALEILRETARILRHNSSAFMAITAVLLCPVSAIVLSNVLVDRSLVERLTVRLFVMAKSTGIPFRPFLKQLLCRKFAEMTVSAAACFPIYASVSLLAKAAIVCSVDCSYSRKRFDSMKFFAVLPKIWKRVLYTYVWATMVVVGCVTLFLLVLAAACSALSAIGAPPEAAAYAAAAAGAAFAAAFASAVAVCHVAVVIAVVEERSGAEAVLRSGVLIGGQLRVGLVLVLWAAAAAAFVEGLFGHRVRTVSYGDGSSRLWEGPLLVLMDAFVALIDAMMSSIFYYSLRSLSPPSSDIETRPILEDVDVAHESA